MIKELENIIEEEIEKISNETLSELLDIEDEDQLRDIIRSEVSAIFFDLFKKRRTWGA